MLNMLGTLICYVLACLICHAIYYNMFNYVLFLMRNIFFIKKLVAATQKNIKLVLYIFLLQQQILHVANEYCRNLHVTPHTIQLFTT